MQIVASDIGKRYGFDWIFRGFNYTFHSKEAYAITGANGSGKSTLLRILTGIEPPTKGTCSYALDHGEVPVEELFRHLALVAPYQQLIEELTLDEHLRFHFKFKGTHLEKDARASLDEVGLTKALPKQVATFSSGMKQRLKLVLAFHSDPQLLFLDEPTVNLDAQGTEWYRERIKQYKDQMTVIICSNQPSEYEICEEVIAVGDFK